MQRSKVSQLPEAVREGLTRRLIANGFSDYLGLEEWLDEQGYQIGKSALHVFGQSLERKLEAIRASTAAARAIAEAAPDDADLRSAATMSLVQTDIFGVLVALQEAAEADPAERLKLLARAAKSIAELSRASVNQKKWEQAMRARVDKAGREVTSAERAGRIRTEDAAVLRAAIAQIMG